MFALSSILSGIEFWSADHTSIYKKNSELKAFRRIRFWYETSSKILLNLVDNCYFQCCNGLTSVISKWGTFSPFSSLVILFLVLASNFVVWAVKSSR